MGCESIQILSTAPYNSRKIRKYLEAYPNISLDTSNACYNDPSEFNYIYNDTNHIVELQLMDCKPKPPKLSFRFSLCQPSSIDGKFIELTTSIGKDLNLKIRIMESCQVEDDDIIFSPLDYENYNKILQEVIKVKRDYWIAMFGEETAVVTCSEAIMKFLVPKCKNENQK